MLALVENSRGEPNAGWRKRAAAAAGALPSPAQSPPPPPMTAYPVLWQVNRCGRNQISARPNPIRLVRSTPRRGHLRAPFPSAGWPLYWFQRLLFSPLWFSWAFRRTWVGRRVWSRASIGFTTLKLWTSFLTIPKPLLRFALFNSVCFWKNFNRSVLFWIQPIANCREFMNVNCEPRLEFLLMLRHAHCLSSLSLYIQLT